MTGIAAIALCAAFTSCSRDFEALTEEELAQIEAQKALLSDDADTQEIYDIMSKSIHRLAND